MRSKFFVRSGFESPKNIKKMLECSDKTFDVVYNWFFEHDQPPRFRDSVTSELLPKIQEDDPELLNGVITGIYSIIRSLHKYRDDFDDYFDDFNVLNPDLVSDDKAKDRFYRLKPLSEKYTHFFEMVKAHNRGAPVLSQASMSVAMKPIIENKFDYDEMDIQTYKPKVVGYTPVVMVELQNSEYERPFSFQMSGREFDRFLNDLLALKVEISEVESEWKK